jgi:hypothetical protein
MDPRWETRRYLKVLRDAWPESQSERFGLVYRGPADFVLQEGRWWSPVDAPAGMIRGVPKACYGNSIGGVLRYGLRYVQGFATSTAAPGLVCPHAWNVDADGNVVDLTWYPVGAAYLGVELSVERADDATWHGDADPIDDYNRRWPLLRERWRGEFDEPDPSWRPSPMMLAWRATCAGDHEEADRLRAIAAAEAGV